MLLLCYCFFVKQKTAYGMRISDWSSDVCSSDLPRAVGCPATTCSAAVCLRPKTSHSYKRHGPFRWLWSDLCTCKRSAWAWKEIRRNTCQKMGRHAHYDRLASSR